MNTTLSFEETSLINVIFRNDAPPQDKEHLINKLELAKDFCDYDSLVDALDTLIEKINNLNLMQINYLLSIIPLDIFTKVA